MTLQKSLEVSYTRADNNSQQQGAEIYLMLLHWHIAIRINAESSPIKINLHLQVHHSRLLSCGWERNEN